MDITLDQLISKQQGKKGGGGPRRRRNGVPKRMSGGGGRRPMGGRFSFSNDTPAGKWTHDKFSELYGGGGEKSIGRRIGGRRMRNGGDSSDIVKLNISNLPASVITADLEELFQDFNVYGVTVHYDETGAHLGTADLFVDAQAANNILREFRGIAIDNQEMKFALVDEGAAKLTIMDRVRRVRNNPIRNRKSGGVGSGSGRGPRRGGNGRGNPLAGAGGGKAAQLTTDDLDKELEAYMSIGKSIGN